MSEEQLLPCPFQFGDYVGIEQKRYNGVPNEIYCYRVVSTDMHSTRYRPVPFDANDPSSATQRCGPVLLVVNASLTSPESDLHYVRPCDVTPWGARAQPGDHDELCSSLEMIVRQLTKAEANAAFGGAATAVRVKDGAFLVETMQTAISTIKALVAEKQRMREALQSCIDHPGNTSYAREALK